MGADIHMKIVSKDNFIIKENFIDGIRDYDWFDNLQGNGDRIYDDFPAYTNFPGLDLDLVFPGYHENYYYGLKIVNIAEFIEWCNKRRPWIDAGWITTYDKFLYERKGIYPDDIGTYLEPSDVLADYHFVELFNENDLTLKIYNMLQNGIDMMNFEDTYIVYCFDR